MTSLYSRFTVTAKLQPRQKNPSNVGLRQLAECMVQRGFRDVECAEAVGFSHGQFGLVVETLDHAAGELLPGAEVVQDQGAMRERMTWQHQSSRNLLAQLGDSYSQSCWK